MSPSGYIRPDDVQQFLKWSYETVLYEACSSFKDYFGHVTGSSERLYNSNFQGTIFLRFHG
jgi:hypothetical protein